MENAWAEVPPLQLFQHPADVSPAQGRQFPSPLQGQVGPLGLHGGCGLLLGGRLQMKRLHPAANGGQQLLCRGGNQEKHPVLRRLFDELEQLVLGGLQGPAAQKEDVHAHVRLLRHPVGVGGHLGHSLNSKGAGRPAPFHHTDIGMCSGFGPHAGGAHPAGGMGLVPAHKGLGQQPGKGPLAAARLPPKEQGVGKPSPLIGRGQSRLYLLVA